MPTGRMQKERRSRIGPFTVKVRLGQGGMGTVFLCEDPALERLVAVKVLREDLSGEPGNRERFLAEARAVARVSHPHVVQIYQVEAGDAPYFAMEYVKGASVAETLRTGQGFTPQEAAGVAAQAARGLCALHRSGILHLDVTPANVLVGAGGIAKLVDFGLALRDGTALESVCGTPCYMAPEQVEGGVVDVRTDIYGLGATLYHMLTGVEPFAGSPREKLPAAKLSGEPAAVRRVRPEVPAHLAAVCERMLARNPQARYQDVESVVRDLEHAGARRGAGHLVLGMVVFLAALLAAWGAWARRPRADLGDLAAFRAGDGPAAVVFADIARRGLDAAHVFKPARPDGPLPDVTAEGLLFSDGAYDILFPPLRLSRVRLEGLALTGLRGHFRVSFGHVEHLYRSINLSFRGGARERPDVVLFAVAEGRVVMEEALPVGEEFRRCLGAGIDIEIDMAARADGRIAIGVNLHPAGGRESLLGGRRDWSLPSGPRGGTWQDGVLRLTLDSVPPRHRRLRVAGMVLDGTFMARAISAWTAGDDLWRRLW